MYDQLVWGAIIVITRTAFKYTQAYHVYRDFWYYGNISLFNDSECGVGARGEYSERINGLTESLTYTYGLQV